LTRAVPELILAVSEFATEDMFVMTRRMFAMPGVIGAL